MKCTCTVVDLKKIISGQNSNTFLRKKNYALFMCHDEISSSQRNFDDSIKKKLRNFDDSTKFHRDT